MERFTWQSDLDIEEEKFFINEMTELETGIKHYRNMNPVPAKTWVLTFEELTEKAVAISAFYDLMLGDMKTFLWTCPLDGIDYYVRFNGKFKRKVKIKQIHHFSVKLERDLNYV